MAEPYELLVKEYLSSSDLIKVGLIFGALGELREVIGDATADYRIQREAEQRIVDIVLEGFLTRSIRIPGNTFPPILFAEETSYDGTSWSGRGEERTAKRNRRGEFKTNSHGRGA